MLDYALHFICERNQGNTKHIGGQIKVTLFIKCHYGIRLKH